MNRALIQKAVDEARDAEANLVVWDERDTFTLEQEDLADLEVGDDYLQVSMQNGRITVYLQFDRIYKLVVDRERSRRPGARTGFGAASG